MLNVPWETFGVKLTRNGALSHIQPNLIGKVVLALPYHPSQPLQTCCAVPFSCISPLLRKPESPTVCANLHLPPSAWPVGDLQTNGRYQIHPYAMGSTRISANDVAYAYQWWDPHGEHVRLFDLTRGDHVKHMRSTREELTSKITWFNDLLRSRDKNFRSVFQCTS